MELNKREAIVGLLKETIRLVNDNKICSESLLSKNRFSYRKLCRMQLYKQYMDISVSRSSVISDPVTYGLFRELKFIVEGIQRPSLSLAEVQIKYSEEINQIQNLSFDLKSTTDFSLEYPELYGQFNKLSHWPLIKYLVFKDSTGDYFYWIDNDLITKAGDYDNFTDLKYSECNLHRNIMGRGLKSAVELSFPQYLTSARVGLGKKVYRSLGELVFGNMVHIAQLQDDVIWQYDTGLCRKNSNKSMTSDFYIKSLNLLIEVSMFIENGRGSRGKNYDLRRKEKVDIYNKMDIKYLFIDSSEFYQQGCFLALKFALAIVEELNKLSYFALNKTVDVDESKLGFFESLDAKPELTAEEYLVFLEEKFDLTHTAQLSQDKSFLRQVIKLRFDANTVFKLLTEKGKERRKMRCKNR